MSVLCSSLEPRDEEQEQTHETEEYESTPATTGCSRNKSRSPQTNVQLEGFWLYLARGVWISFVLVELLVLILSLVATRGESYSICPFLVDCTVSSGNGSSAASFVNCSFQLCELQSDAGTAAIAGLSGHRRLHLLAQIERTHCSGCLHLLREYWIGTFLSSDSSINVPARGDLLEYLWSVRLYGARLLSGDVSRWPFCASLELVARRTLAGAGHL